MGSLPLSVALSGRGGHDLVIRCGRLGMDFPDEVRRTRRPKEVIGHAVQCVAGRVGASGEIGSPSSGARDHIGMLARIGKVADGDAAGGEGGCRRGLVAFGACAVAVSGEGVRSAGRQVGERYRARVRGYGSACRLARGGGLVVPRRGDVGDGERRACGGNAGRGQARGGVRLGCGERCGYAAVVAVRACGGVRDVADAVGGVGVRRRGERDGARRVVVRAGEGNRAGLVSALAVVRVLDGDVGVVVAVGAGGDGNRNVLRGRGVQLDGVCWRCRPR